MTLSFLGEHEYRVDAKGRIPLPPSFRERLLREGGVISQDVDGCIRIYPLKEWDRFKEKILAKLPENDKGRKIRRFFNSLSMDLVVDRQNRITLPPTFREHAGIKEQDMAVVNGVGDYIEIWSKNRWQSERNTIIEQAWEILESLEQKE